MKILHLPNENDFCWKAQQKTRKINCLIQVLSYFHYCFHCTSFSALLLELQNAYFHFHLKIIKIFLLIYRYNYQKSMANYYNFVIGIFFHSLITA